MSKLSRRGLLTGAFFKRPPPADSPGGDVPHGGLENVADLLARSRNRAPMQAPATPPAPLTTRVARVASAGCLTTVTCQACLHRCPTPGALTDSGRLPVVVAELCTGCGDCVAACPAPGIAMAMEAR